MLCRKTFKVISDKTEYEVERCVGDRLQTVEWLGRQHCTAANRCDLSRQVVPVNQARLPALVPGQPSTPLMGAVKPALP